jgi:hypothetical protein
VALFERLVGVVPLEPAQALLLAAYLAGEGLQRGAQVGDFGVEAVEGRV